MVRTKGNILWVDDEIDHLKSHILFLEERGYLVTPVSNAEDALSLIQRHHFDIVLLDEMLTGMDGLQALNEFHSVDPSLPVVMITKSEEENIMEEAIGQRIEDYLTKPVNPSQILSSCKRILESRRISREKLTREYTVEFGEISSLLNRTMGCDEWVDIHLKLSEREVELDGHPGSGLDQTVQDQRRECNQAFGRFVEQNYAGWVRGDHSPVLSVNVIEKYVFPLLSRNEKVLFIVIDNLRLDQWLLLEPLLYDWYTVQRSFYFSILPTATPYSRNALFAGLFPREIAVRFPEVWRSGEEDSSSRNRNEADLLLDQMKRLGLDLSDNFKYFKILDGEESRQILNNVDAMMAAKLTALVINFVDILAHRRSESQILKQIVPDEAAYRALTKTWFERSPLLGLLQAASRKGVNVVITSDHGSIRASRGAIVYADRETSTSLRYKTGKGIRSEEKQVLEIRNPKDYGLPAGQILTNYLIAKEDYYFVYPNNYHQYLALYRDSFQHGGISMQEMILPITILQKHKRK